MEEGWIAAINFREHVLKELNAANLDYYIVWGGELEDINWRTFNPMQLFQIIESLITKRIG